MKIFEILENVEMFSRITAKRIFIDIKSMDKPTYYGLHMNCTIVY